MLQMQIGSGLPTNHFGPTRLARKLGPCWIPVLALSLLGGPGTETTGCAQTTPGATAAETSSAAQPAASSITPLPRFVAQDKLIFYLDFDGLDAHAEAWQKTAAYKMLNQTPLGVMLEEVAAQLLDRGLDSLPNRKLSGAEIVTLIKHMARKGWVLALNANQKGANPFVGTCVLRGATAPKDKEIKSIASRLMGMLMGADAKPKIERKAGRVLVAVPTGSTADAGWAWWPEKDDLIIGFMQPSSSDAIISVIDGKTPSAADHPVLKDLAKQEGSFLPLMKAVVDPTTALHATGGPTSKMEEFFEQFKSKTGVTRLDYRWGFDDDALMSVTRLTAPSPRKPVLAIFDQPPLDTKNLIPMPEGVESFVTLSVSPAKALEAINQIGITGEAKEQIDEVMEKIRSQSHIDFNKDFLSNIGPRMSIYLSPMRSAAATDEATQAPAGAGGFNMTAMLSSLQGALPKPTLVAELQDPVAFGKALDSIMLTVNKELKAQAMERAAEDEKAGEAGKAPGQGQAPGRGFSRGPGGPGSMTAPGGRPARKRSLKDTPAPEFRLMPGDVKIYMLRVPTDSPLKILPPGVHPTIRMEGNHVAFATSSEAARTALDTIKKKGWKPGPDVEQVLAHLPSGPIFVAVADPRETMPSVLASLPGTLQAQINTAIAMSTAKSPDARPGGAGLGQPGGGPGGPPGGPGMSMSRPGFPGGSGPPGSSGPGMSMSRPGFPGGSGPPGSSGPGMSMSRPGFPGGSGPPGSSGFLPGSGGPNNTPNASGTQDSMIELKVDAAKLPKAEELKALMFPGTMALVVDDASIRLVSREAFPNIVSGMNSGAVGGALLAPALQAARAAPGQQQGAAAR